MPLSAKAKRRLPILLAAIVVLAGVVVGVYFWQQSAKDKQIQALLTEGVAAFENKNYEDAVGKLSKFHTAREGTAESLYAFGVARYETAEEGATHVAEAVDALQQAIDKSGQHQKAAYRLIDIYSPIQSDDAADAVLPLANDLLKEDDEDVPALRAKAEALLQRGDYEQALQSAEKAIELEPDHWRTRWVALRLRAALDHDPSKLIEQTTELEKAHPDDPRYKLLVAVAHRAAWSTQADRQSDAAVQHRQSSIEWLQGAAEGASLNDEFISILVSNLDTVRAFDLSRQVLADHVDRDNNLPLLHEMTVRLFEAGQMDQVADRLEHFDVDGENLSKLETRLAALRAAALFQIDRADEADTIVQSLANRENHPRANTWAAVLEVVYGPAQPEPSRIRKVSSDALNTFRDEPLFYAYRASAYAELGELELAIKDWRRVIELRGIWARPHMQLARLLLARGDAETALRHAYMAEQLQPSSVSAKIVAAQAMAQTLDPNTANDPANEVQVERLMRWINAWRTAEPGSAQALMLHVNTLGRLGRNEQAANVLRTALNGQQQWSQAALANLARLSNAHGLGLTERIRQRIETDYADTPETAYARARELAQNGQPDAGLALIESRLDQHTGDGVNRWRLARAQYLKTIGDERATDAWIALADDHPQNATLQQRALNAPDVWQHREFANRAVQRLHDALGEDSFAWQMARARWLLSGPDDQRDPETAVNLLDQTIAQYPDRVDPYRLLAKAYEQRGLIGMAVPKMRDALELRPDSIPLALELARLQQALRQYGKARDELQRIINRDSATPDQVRRAAHMLAAQGAYEPALNALQRIEREGGELNTADLLLMAKLYRRASAHERVEAICRRLMEAPSASAIAFVADYYAARDQPDAARATLERRTSIDMPDYHKALLMAQFESRHGSDGQAVAHFERAAKLAPQEPAIWHQLIALQLQLDQRDAAIAAARRARQHLPDNVALRVLVQQADVLLPRDGSSGLRGAVSMVLREVDRTDAAADVLSALADARRNDASNLDLAQRLAQLAEQHTQFLPLQVLAARLYLMSDEPEAALNLAERATENHPTAAQPALLASEAYAATGRWNQARTAAEAWRQRSSGGAIGADMMIAEADLNAGQFSNALRTLEPYIERAKARPDEYAPVLLSYARGLISTGRADEAAELLAPLIDRSAQWRISWMQLAAQMLPQRDTAAEWLDRAAKRIDDSAIQERVVLAKSWWQVGGRFDDGDARQRARGIVRQLTERGDAGATVWYWRGVFAEQGGDLSEAEQSYRSALRRDADMHMARNNLAMVLLNRDTPAPQEALTQARRAADAMPDHANYLDTLAQAQAAAGQCEQAIETMRRVVRMEPDNELWRRNQADLIARCGEEGQAGELPGDVEAGASASQ